MLTKKQADHALKQMKRWVSEYSKLDTTKYSTTVFLNQTLYYVKRAMINYQHSPKYYDEGWVVMKAKKNMTTKGGSKVKKGIRYIARPYQLEAFEKPYVEVACFDTPYNTLYFAVFASENFILEQVEKVTPEVRETFKIYPD